MGKSTVHNALFTVAELIESRIETSIEAYQSIIWKMKVLNKNNVNMEDVYKDSIKRMAEQINAEPPRWIYSSIFTNELSNMLDTTTSIKSFVNRLEFLYEKFILPNNLNFSLVISKTHEFWLNRVKLSKLFGVFKIL